MPNWLGGSVSRTFGRRRHELRHGRLLRLGRGVAGEAEAEMVRKCHSAVGMIQCNVDSVVLCALDLSTATCHFNVQKRRLREREIDLVLVSLTQHGDCAALAVGRMLDGQNGVGAEVRFGQLLDLLPDLRCGAAEVGGTGAGGLANLFHPLLAVGLGLFGGAGGGRRDHTNGHDGNDAKDQCFGFRFHAGYLGFCVCCFQ